MKKRIVIALGGNALGSNLTEQMEAVKNTSKAIADLLEEGHEVVVSHGNGPQVGMINLAMSEYAKNNPGQPEMPLSVCVAMSQAYIGYDLQNALREELLSRGIDKPVATLVTQVVVDPADEAFKNPTKPIGAFMTKEEADALIAKGEQVKEDAGRGYRRVVASPRPKEIVEIETVKELLDAGQVVIAGGGGGIPVIREGKGLKGVGAVIDKDFASCVLAQNIDADAFIVLTAVEKAAINWGKENEEWLGEITTEQARQYMGEGHFAPGSMLPKVEAATLFAESKEGRTALITLLEKAKDGIAGKTGTAIRK
ncbi:MAG: carbamate kinase [Eubacteriales bacterium]|nr:carbamate kinase [Eubacteriales bacterium]